MSHYYSWHDALNLAEHFVYTECTEGAVRLAGGPNRYEGRLEVCHEGLWGSVCNNGWSAEIDGAVVCRQIGGLNATGSKLATFLFVVACS